MFQEKELIVSKNSASCRLDKFIHLSCKNVSRAFIQNLIKGKKILVNNKVSKASYKVKEDDRILIEKNELLEPRAKKEKIQSTLDLVNSLAKKRDEIQAQYN